MAPACCAFLAWLWRSSAHGEQQVPLKANDQVQSWQVQQHAKVWTAKYAVSSYVISDLQVIFADPPSSPYQHAIRGSSHGQLKVLINGKAKSFEFAWTPEGLWLQHQEDQLWVQDQRLQPSTSTQSKHGNEVLAPMHGRVVKLHVADGDEVKAGQLLLVMEAMKMEHHLNAPRDGVIKHVAVQTGVQVALRQSLVHFV